MGTNDRIPPEKLRHEVPLSEKNALPSIWGAGFFLEQLLSLQSKWPRGLSRTWARALSMSLLMPTQTNAITTAAVI